MSLHIILGFLVVWLIWSATRISDYLAGDHGKNYGRVEVYTNNMRGTICDDNWDNNDATVVCRQLGLPTSYATALGSAALGMGSGPTWMDDVDCAGTERDVRTCTFPGFGKENCGHGEDAAVLCQGTYVSIYLGGTHGTNFGRVQVVTGKNTSVGTVCDDVWDNNDAVVACRQLGHPTSNVRAIGGGKFGKGSGPIWLDNVECAGTESNIHSCNSNSIGISDCDHSEDAGIICGYDLGLRLRNPVVSKNVKDGVIQIQYNNKWINVKYGSVTSNVLSVLCRQLGIQNNGTRKVYHVRNEDTNFKNAQMLTFVECDGDETNIGHCQFTVTDSGVVYSETGFNDANSAAFIVCEETGIGILNFQNISSNGSQILVPRGTETTLVCTAGPSIPRQIITWDTIPNSAITDTYEISNDGKYTTISTLTFTTDTMKHNNTRIHCRLERTYGSVSSINEMGIIYVGVSENSASTLFASTTQASITDDLSIQSPFMYGTISLGVAVLICLGIVVVLIVKMKRNHGKKESYSSPLEEKQNSHASPLEEIYENASDNQSVVEERYEELQF